MKLLVLMIAMTGVVFSAKASETLNFKCVYNSPLAGCAGNGRLQRVIIEIKDDQFSYIEDFRACFFQSMTEYSGVINDKSTAPRTALNLKLQSDRKRSLQMGEGSPWEADNSSFKMIVDTETMTGTVTNKRNKKKLKISCE